ncbi:hypothetical protein [uncultured Bacteroides sp.]|uniref:hypothetical protein n=1 Tax=uncultured Bacteroides sp. TaxID=162156 RepID=UPI0025ED0D55|nr:hypothetical protein [uncultured Bacteroides sp.]
MYHKRKIRVYIAWMLFMTFLPFFVVKTFHYHGSEGETSCSDTRHASHNHSDGCAICKYSLSLFTEPQPLEFHFSQALIPYELIIPLDKVVCRRTYSHQLRAPPVA